VGEEEYEMKISVLCHWSSKNLTEEFLFICLFAVSLISATSLCMFYKLLCFNCKDFEADLLLLLFAGISKILSKETGQSLYI